jgi:hypothetical protein
MGWMSRGDVASRLAAEELGTTEEVLCREPWESYYILRRGILPCCHGSKPIAPMEDAERAWNSPELQEIRRYLAAGQLSPYCLESTGCPIVQRHLLRQRTRERWLPDRLRVLGKLNRLFRGMPARLYYRVVRRGTEVVARQRD